MIPVLKNHISLKDAIIIEGSDYLSEQIFFIENNNFLDLAGENDAFKEKYQQAQYKYNAKTFGSNEIS